MEVDEERTRLVLSNRRAVAAAQAQGLHVGDVVLGRVQSLKPYGAFIEMGGVSGLLHISQISHDRVTNVESVLKEGDELKVMPKLGDWHFEVLGPGPCFCSIMAEPPAPVDGLSRRGLQAVGAWPAEQAWSGLRSEGASWRAYSQWQSDHAMPCLQW